MGAARWLLASFIAILALILGNIYALSLPYDLARQFYFFEKVFLSEVASIAGSWTIWQTVNSALQRTRPKIRRVLKTILASYLIAGSCSIIPVMLWRVGSVPHWYGFIIFAVYFHLVVCVVLLRLFFKGVACVARCGLIKLHHRKSFVQEQQNSSPDFIPSRLGRVSLLVVFIYSVSVGLYGVHQAWQPPQVVEVKTLPVFLHSGAVEKFGHFELQKFSLFRMTC